MQSGSRFILLANLLTCFTLFVYASDTVPPNIVVIIADDLGWNDVGFHGSNQIPTPNIDALAYNGVILNRHYTLPTCTPSRTAYLTGRYPIRSGMQGAPIYAGEPRGLPVSETLLPQHLKRLGYKTRIVGKWHLGQMCTKFMPTRRGFDSFLGYWNGFLGYFNHTIDYNDEECRGGLDFHRNLNITRDYEGQYATDVFTHEAVDIIKHHDKSRPLYLHLAHLAVHAGKNERPLEVPDVEAAHKRFSYIKSRERRLYAEMVNQLDKSVSRVVQALSDGGILNNSIIVFFADNGAPTIGTYRNWGSNRPLRGMKGSVHEGGVRGVAAIWSPWFHQPGRVSNQLFHLTDWLPTLYSAAGGNPTDLGELDGVDQWKSLINIIDSSPRTELLVNIDDVDQSAAFIKDSWKLKKTGTAGRFYDHYYGDFGQSSLFPLYNIHDIITSQVNRALTQVNYQRNCVGCLWITIPGLRYEATVHCLKIESVDFHEYSLYNIIEDPCETVNLADYNKELVKKLVDDMNKYRDVMIPELNQPLDPASSPEQFGNVWIPWLESTCESNEIKHTK